MHNILYFSRNPAKLCPSPAKLGRTLASPAGIGGGLRSTGIIIHGEWVAFQLSSSWKVEGHDICWLETISIELLALFLESTGHCNAHLLVHSDNQGTIGALDKGRSGNIYINLAVRCTHLILMATSLVFKTIYIESHANPADPISRREPGPAGKQMFPSFKLPDELSSCFLHA